VDVNAHGYHSLEQMVEVARDIAADSHHFRFIQLPVSLAMPEALFLPNQKVGDEWMTVVEAAQRRGVNVIASASILQGQVARGLPEAIREAMGSLATDAQTGIQFVRSAPGVTTALVGMSNLAHVEENLELVQIEPAAPANVMSLLKEEA
jgi:predicted aldo/keto reductase-like oxidoreductase